NLIYLLRGYLGPGGLHENAEFFNCTGGASGHIDRSILGDHMYQKAEVKEIYQSKNVEPEGLLGFFTSILHVVIGAQAGVTLQTFKDHTERLKRWFSWGAILAFIGGGLCGFSKEGGLIPINKQLWSTSFVFVTCGSSFLLLCTLYFLIDVKKVWNGKPFSFCGMNAILLYVGHNLSYSIFPIRWIPPGGLNNYFITLTENVWGVSMWILVAYCCYKMKYFLTV
ncbi:heparan-alpha-glucosaminide N-acetyltransferase-like, partial [Agrilus planipennis]|uniref:Heparan-alpha-glucosaminide N-acetyltransferase-like n=1 Tax=Agrilus planipennis TaxID=224129 RepID=A0A7F5RIU4_AGRPL